jgi:hypothetical protein
MKVHRYECEEPLVNVKGLTVACKKFVSPAAIVYFRDGCVYDKNILWNKNECHKCFETPLENKRYLYGVANAQELKQREGSE